MNQPVGNTSVIWFGDFSLAVSERQLTRHGEPVALPPKALDLLILLVETPGHLLRREELMEALWPGRVVTDDSLATCVKNVRKALGDDAANPRFVETVPKTGYRFVADVNSARSPPRRIAIIVGVLVLAVGLVVIGGLFMLTRGSESILVTPAVPESVPAVAISTVAMNAEREYQLGIDKLQRRQATDAEGHFLKALEANPEHAGALAGLGMAHMITREINDPAVQAQIMGLAEQALAIDPDMGRALALVGGIYATDWRRYPQAESMLRRAIEADPDVIEAYVWLAMITVSDGRLTEAIDIQRKGLAISPAHDQLNAYLTIHLLMGGQTDEAKALADSLALSPDTDGASTMTRKMVKFVEDDRHQSLLFMLEHLERSPQMFHARNLAWELAKLGDVDGSRRILTMSAGSCESPEQRLRGEARVLQSLADATILAQRLAAVESFDYWRDARKWSGVLGFLTDDHQQAVENFAVLFPIPEQVAGWDGWFAEPADLGQQFAWSLTQSGFDARAERIIRHIDREAQKRWANGFSRIFYPLVVIEARGAAMLGDAERAIQLLRENVAAGWIDVTAFDDPRWGRLSMDSRFIELTAAVQTSASAEISALESHDFHRRLDVVLAQLSASHSTCSE